MANIHIAHSAHAVTRTYLATFCAVAATQKAEEHDVYSRTQIFRYILQIAVPDRAPYGQLTYGSRNPFALRLQSTLPLFSTSLVRRCHTTCQAYSYLVRQE